MRNYKILYKTEKKRDIRHPENEDSMLYAEFSFFNDVKVKLMIVCDGIGSLSKSNEASREAAEGFAECIQRQLRHFYMEKKEKIFSVEQYKRKVEELLILAVAEANLAVCMEVPEGGTTLSAVLILDDYAFSLNVGDSPVYFFDSSTENLKMISELHTVAERKVRGGYYDRYSPAYYRHSHILTKSLGEMEEMERDEICVKTIGYLDEGDFVLIGTDGAFGHLKEEEILNLIKKSKPYNVLDDLFEEAGRTDDQTAIFYEVCKEVKETCC